MRMKSVLALSVLTASVFASTLGQASYCGKVCPPASYCGNFLLGGEIGWARQKENFTTQFVAPSLPIAPINIYQFPAQSVMITDQGAIFGLLAGWQFRANRLLAGIEGNVDFQDFDEMRNFAFTDAVTGLHGISGTLRYERGPVYALTLRAGYFVTPGFMPYVRVGAQYMKDEITYSSLITTGLPAPLPPVLPDFVSKKENVWGAVAGIGVEFPAFIGASTLRFESTYAVTENVVIDDTVAPIIGTHNFRHPQPETVTLKVAWVWNFI